MDTQRPKPVILDTFPAFLRYWAHVRNAPLEEQIEGWEQTYLAPWPELLAKQIGDYREQQVDWWQIAKEKIFPYFDQRLPDMKRAHSNLLSLCRPVFLQAQRALGFDSPVIFLIHVGIGCGAGWVTSFQDSPSILLGLEAIAENGWTGQPALSGLLAHEIGHLALRHWLRQAGRELPEDAWGQLFDEGFAQYSESSLLGHGSFHESLQDEQGDWLEWCESHKSWLASEYLRCVEAGEPVSKFFGSWFDIRGRKQTGYYLGYEVIKCLVSEGRALQEVALLDPRARLRPVLQSIAGQHSR